MSEPARESAIRARLYEAWNALTFDWETAPEALRREAVAVCRKELDAMLTGFEGKPFRQWCDEQIGDGLPPAPAAATGASEPKCGSVIHVTKVGEAHCQCGCVVHARQHTQRSPDAATLREPDWQRRYEDEYNIVARCWAALGVSEFDNGPPIWERIATLREREREAFMAGYSAALGSVDDAYFKPGEAYAAWQAQRAQQGDTTP